MLPNECRIRIETRAGLAKTQVLNHDTAHRPVLLTTLAKPNPYLQQQVEQVSNYHNSKAHHSHESENQRELKNLAKDDHFGK